MKKLIKTLLTVASFATVLGFASCNNPNDNVAQRGITITGIQVRPADATYLANQIAPSSTSTFASAEMVSFVFAGVGLNGWSDWTSDKAFSGICLDGVIRAIPGDNLDSSNYTYVYNDLEFCGVGDGDWDNYKIADADSNFKVENPKDGKTYYVDVVVSSDGTAEASLVEGTLGPNIVKVTVTNLSGAGKTPGTSVSVASNISWGGVKKGAWSLTDSGFGNDSLTAPVENDSVTFYVTGNYDVTGTWVAEQAVTGSNFKLEITNAAGDKLSGKQDAWYNLVLTGKKTTIDIVNDMVTE